MGCVSRRLELARDRCSHRRARHAAVPRSAAAQVNVWTLTNITAGIANLTVTFDIYRLPPSIQNNNDKTLSLLYLMYNKSYDVVITVRARACVRAATTCWLGLFALNSRHARLQPPQATQVNGVRASYMQFLTAYQAPSPCPTPPPCLHLTSHAFIRSPAAVRVHSGHDAAVNAHGEPADAAVDVGSAVHDQSVDHHGVHPGRRGTPHDVARALAQRGRLWPRAPLARPLRVPRTHSAIPHTFLRAALSCAGAVHAADAQGDARRLLRVRGLRVQDGGVHPQDGGGPRARAGQRVRRLPRHLLLHRKPGRRLHQHGAASPGSRARAAACFACCARASSFAATPPPCGRPQLITSIDSFGEQGLPACIQNKARHGRAGRELGRAGHRRNGTTLTRRIPMCCGQSVYIQFVQSHYPSTQLVLVPEYPEARARGLGEKSGLRFPLAREGDPGGGAALARARARRTW